MANSFALHAQRYFSSTKTTKTFGSVSAQNTEKPISIGNQLATREALFNSLPKIVRHKKIQSPLSDWIF
jgi:hypothetical protein